MSEYSFARQLTVFFFLVFGLSTTSVGLAHSHGDPPAAQRIFALDGDWVFVTNFGVISSFWPEHYVCEEAFFGSQRFFVLPLSPTHWATFTRRTAAVTEDGCHFQRTLELPAAPTDVAVRPEDNELAFTVQNNDIAEVWFSDDGGHFWQELDLDLSGLRPTGLGFLASQQLIIVGYANTEEDRGRARIIEFDLSNGSRTEHPIDDDLRYPGLLDARNGHFLWHARRNETNEIFWSQPDDLWAGHFLSPRWPTAGALATDGSTAYLGGVDDDNRGVFYAHQHSPSDFEELLAGHRARCLAATDEGLFVCGHRHHDGHDLLFLDHDGSTELVDFRNLQGYRPDCPADSHVEQTCPVVWPETARALGIEVPEPLPDGEPDPEPADEEEDEIPVRSCSQNPAPGPWSLAFLVLLALIRAPLVSGPVVSAPGEPTF